MKELLTFGTLFENLWDFLSSGTAVTVYFIILFLSIAALIITVLTMINTEKKAEQMKEENMGETE